MLENFIMQVRRLKGVSSERVAFVSRSGVLIFQHSIILIYNVYGTIDYTNVRRNRIGQNLGKDNGSMVCRTKLLSQLGVTAPIESLHNLIETLKLIGQDILSPFSEISGDIAQIFCLVPRSNMFHMHAKFQVCSSGQFLNQLWTNKQTKTKNH